MKKYIFTGLITLLPVALTVLIINYFFDLFTDPFLGGVKNLLTSYTQANEPALAHHDAILLFLSRVIVLILLFLLVLLLGFLGRKFFMDTLLSLTNKIFLRIPVVKTIYKMIKEITKATFSQEEKTFKQTVLIPFPSSQTHALGFITGEVPPAIKKLVVNAEYAIFVPTSPHPISGFLLMAPKKQITEVDISTEDVFKFLLSCGMVQPGEEPKKTEPLPP